MEDPPGAPGRALLSDLDARRRRLVGRLRTRRSIDAERALVDGSGLFDGAWYLRAYPDVAGSGIDPLEHFLRYGGAEGRDPGPRFSSGIYLRRHPRVAAVHANALVHWLRSTETDHDATPSGPPLLDDPRILFVHIPKTAGTSLYTALMWWATKPRSVRFEHGGDDLPRWLALPDDWLREGRLVGGHLWFTDFGRRDLTGWSPITLLRDPVQRALSTYTFIRQDADHPWHGRVQGMSLDAFLDWLAEQDHNLDEQCRFICGAPDAELAWTTLSSQFSLAATVDGMAGFGTALSRLIGSRLDALTLNRSHRPIDPTTLDPATRARIDRLSHQDQRLVERVAAAGLVGRDMATLEAASRPPVVPWVTPEPREGLSGPVARVMPAGIIGPRRDAATAGWPRRPGRGMQPGGPPPHDAPDARRSSPMTGASTGPRTETAHDPSPAAGRPDRTEDGLAERLGAVTDRSSGSDAWSRALEDAASQRLAGDAPAAIIALLRLRAGMRALHVGARAGAIARALADAGVIVDAIEADPGLARLAGARLDGMTGAAVASATLAAWIADATAPPVLYDLVIVGPDAEATLGIASGDAAPAPLLAAIAARLAPEGCVLLTVAEAHGARWLAGPIGDLETQARALAASDGAPARARVEATLRAAGLGEQRWWTAYPDTSQPRALVADTLWDEADGPVRIASLVREPIAPPPPGMPAWADPVALFGELVALGLAPALADARVVAAATSASALEAMTRAPRLWLAPEPGRGRAWRSAMELGPDRDDWQLQPAVVAVSPAMDGRDTRSGGATPGGSARLESGPVESGPVESGPVRWRPTAASVPAGSNGEDVLLAALLEHGPAGPETTRVLRAWWRAVHASLDLPDDGGRRLDADPARHVVRADGAWQRVSDGPTLRFSVPPELIAYGALLRMLQRRLPSAGAPRGVPATETLGGIAVALARSLGMAIEASGEALWVELETDVRVRAGDGGRDHAAHRAVMRAMRDRPVGDLVGAMSVAALRRSVGIALDAEARAATGAAELASRSAELIQRKTELDALRNAMTDGEADHADVSSRATSALALVAHLEADAVVQRVEIERLRGREDGTDHLLEVVRGNGQEIERLRGELAKERARFARHMADDVRDRPVLPTLRRPGRLRSAFTRLREPGIAALIRASGWFDAAWYVERYPDVGRTGIDPALHYLRAGWIEGRDPGPRFHAVGYRRRYPDVAVAGVDPLLHHIRHGAAEGRIVSDVPPPWRPPETTATARSDASPTGSDPRSPGDGPASATVPDEQG